MDPKSLLFLQNTQRQHSSSGGLCRSQKVFGLRVEARLAGTIRATLNVQPAHQFAWNDSLIPS
eukprot:4130235-Amphidinium_carterae.1